MAAPLNWLRLLAERGINKVAGIVSGLPLLNFPENMRLSFIHQCMDALVEGGVLAQFTYAQRAPIAAPKGVHVGLAKRVWLNMPPATVWVYHNDHHHTSHAA
jgi:phosphatidylethanolamine/phosphatidyl-N-methylethanolamine N-methyltransferase